jgi:GT2 family glycosyltransferase
MSIQVSVVVPTCRRPDLLRRCLEALLAQDLDPACYEVIVVNDHPDIATRLVVEEFAAAGQAAPMEKHNGSGRAHKPGLPAAAHSAVSAAPAALKPPPPNGNGHRPALAEAGTAQAFPAVRYLPNRGPRGPAAARNLGWRSAEGELIAFTDDDTLPQPGWLSSALRCFNLESGGRPVDGVNGRVIVPLPQRPTDYELNTAGLETSDFVTANCFYRRATLAALGGFDQDFPLAWLEDRELWFRMLKNGANLVDAPEAVVIHPVRPAQWGVSLKQQRKSMYNALLYKKHPEMFLRMQPTPPWHYYATLTSLLGMLVGLLAGSLPVFALWTAIWAAWTLAFAWKRLKGTSRRLGHVLEMLVTSMLIPVLSVYWRQRGAWKYRVLFF